MKVGDLVSHKHNPDLANTRGVLGMILEVSHAIATVIWFEHEIFGEHECYEMIDDLNFFNKKT